MDHIRQYLLSIIAAAIFCGIAVTLMQKKGVHSSVIKLLTGLFMVVTIISALTQFDFENLQDFALGFSVDAQEAVALGEEFAGNQMREFITQQAEAYIQEKAMDLGADLKVDIDLNYDDPPVPSAVTITGDASPYIKSVLGRYIENNLDIPEESQLWM